MHTKMGLLSWMPNNSSSNFLLMKPLRLFQIIFLGLLEAQFENHHWNYKEASQNMHIVLMHQMSIQCVLTQVGSLRPAVNEDMTF